jgi:hypothetical protein
MDAGDPHRSRPGPRRRDHRTTAVGFVEPLSGDNRYMNIRRPLAALFTALTLFGGSATLTACGEAAGQDQNDGTTDDSGDQSGGEKSDVNDDSDNSDGDEDDQSNPETNTDDETDDSQDPD